MVSRAGTQNALLTNQFRVSLLADRTIYNYSIEFQPDPLKKQYAHVKQELMFKLEQEIKQTFPVYTWSGNNLFSTTSYDFKLELSTEHGETQYFVSIVKVGSLDLKSAETTGYKDHCSLPQTFLNIIFKQILRKNKLQQIGRNANFFDMTKSEVFTDRGMAIEKIPGFHTTTQIYQSGIYLAIEPVNKFLNQETVLEAI